MIQYSFLMEFNVEALKQAGTKAVNWAAKNPGKAGMAAGAAIGGTTNKMKGGSFTGGAIKGAAVGGAAGLGAGALSKTNMGKSLINQTKQVFAKNPAAEAAAKKAANQTKNAANKAKTVARKVKSGARNNPLTNNATPAMSAMI